MTNDTDRVDFDNKEMFKTTCQNGHVCYVFVNHVREESYTACKICNNKDYLVKCTKCSLEFDIQENRIKIGDKGQLWKCEVCGKFNNLSSQAKNNLTRNYLKKDIPEKTWKLQMSQPTRIDPSLLGINKQALNIILVIILLVSFFLLAYSCYYLWVYISR